MCAQRKAGRPSVPFPAHGPLWCITSHSFRARLCHAKNEAPEEEAAIGKKTRRIREKCVFGVIWSGNLNNYSSYFNELHCTIFNSFPSVEDVEESDDSRYF